jgi:glycerophosphoryl diester phosphodiesterase
MKQLQRKPLIIAHRGASGTAPENTLAAVERALALGVDGIEVDVQLTKDLVPVIIHDRTVDRTTNGSGRVSSLTLDEIRRLDAGSWFNQKYPRRASELFIDLKVPRLEEVIDITASTQSRLYLDVKYATWPVELASAVYGIVERKACWDRVFFTSSDHFSLGVMKHVKPDGRTAPLFDWRWAAKGAPHIVSLAQQWQADEVSLHHTICTNRLIHMAHQQGLKVVVWSINQRRLMRQFIRSAVDAIITNFPGQLRQELAGKGSMEEVS